MVLLGVIALGGVFGLTIATVTFFGILMTIGGVGEVVHCFAARKWSGFFLHLLVGILYVIAGGYMIVHPVAASMALTLILGWAIVITGVSRIIVAFRMHGQKNSVWVLISGIIAVLVGGMILARWPLSSLWIIGLFVAVELIANGWSMIMVSLAIRAGNRPVS
jgi:uncharacterized membrane protein HdeD (DUF308 family)